MKILLLQVPKLVPLEVASNLRLGPRWQNKSLGEYSKKRVYCCVAAQCAQILTKNQATVLPFWMENNNKKNKQTKTNSPEVDLCQIKIKSSKWKTPFLSS